MFDGRKEVFIFKNSCHASDKKNRNSEMEKSTPSQKTDLSASEIRYRSLFESAKDGILILDAQTGMIVDVNPFLMELLGYSKESFIKKTIWEIGFFKDIIDNKEKFLELQRKKYLRYEDLPLETADGRKINVEFVSNVYLVDNQKVIQCNIRDITKRKETEVQLEKARKKLAAIKIIRDEESKFVNSIINTVREPLLVLDKKLRVIKASHSFYSYFKVKPEDTIGKLIYELGNNQWDIPKLKQLLEKILPEKTTFDNYEVEHDFSSIGRRIVLLNARQIKRGLGKEKIILLAFEDVTERLRKENILSEKSRLTNEYLNILLNHAHAPIITWDDSLLIKRFNPEFEKLSGYKKSEVEDKKIEILFPKDEVSSTLELIRNNIGVESTQVIEINILTKNNEIKTVLWNSANILDEEGKKTIATIAQDITSRKRSEEELINSKKRYRRLFESAKDGILILNAQTGMIVDVNLFLIKLLGYSKESFTKKPVWEIGFLKDITQNKEKFWELQQNEYVRYEDLPLETSDGRKIHVEFVSNVYLVNNQKVIQCNIRDITERKKLETNLSTATEIAKLEYWEFDVISQSFTFDDQYYRLIHGSSTDKQGGNIMSAEEFTRRLVHPDDSKIVAQNLQKAISSSDPNYAGQAEARVFRDNGDISNVLVQFKVEKDDTGRTFKVVGINQNITEQKHFEQELIYAKEKAEESDRLKTAFLANMSHEIRTPMNGILGFTELLREPKLTGKEQQEFINIIEKSGVRMLNIINDIINISRIESGQIEISATDVNIKVLAQDIFNFFKPEADHKKLRFSYKNILSESEVNTKTDKVKVYAVLTNLVKNALKFTQTGFIEMGYEKKGKFLEFFVKDTGSGVPTEQKELIFERFRQGNDSLTRDYEGAGLGLAISKAYVEMLGGKIWIERNKGQGSTFRFTIPYINGLETKEQLIAIKAEVILYPKKLKILIVDDDEASRMLLKIIIQPLASNFYQANTGYEAIEACRNYPGIDLVLMDINMSGMNGLEATRQIRKFNEEVVIIAQTAYALTGDREKSLEAGCNDYISKPIKKVLLIELIKKHFKEEENKN